jgi:hypothetical protein
VCGEEGHIWMCCDTKLDTPSKLDTQTKLDTHLKLDTHTKLDIQRILKTVHAAHADKAHTHTLIHTLCRCAVACHLAATPPLDLHTTHLSCSAGSPSPAHDSSGSYDSSSTSESRCTRSRPEPHAYTSNAVSAAQGCPLLRIRKKD